MTQGDGNGWVGCDRDHRHWGRHGAAGLLIWAPDGSGRPLVLLIRRAEWSHHGGTWGPPGGARDSHESPAEAAMREAAEECGAPPGVVRIHGLLNDDHGGWSYQTLIGQAAEPFTVRPGREATETAWIPADDVASLPLHPGFAATWPVIRKALEPVTLIVDGANVMGSRADGWWRDRAGAMTRLYGELAALAADGIARLPDDGDEAALDRWYPQFVLVVEGKARALLGRVPGDGAVQVVAAPGEGDDTIVDLARRLPGRRFVVTADRELRRRSVAAGAAVTGPRWLTALLK
ncbi:MAG TPA: NUDIX domain-containing protein [Streptosporangiaceae bacterium]|nr:NUDIX domain-containing protein [Streptosporangiaceae bacterium]